MPNQEPPPAPPAQPAPRRDPFVFYPPHEIIVGIDAPATPRLDEDRDFASIGNLAQLVRKALTERLYAGQVAALPFQFIEEGLIGRTTLLARLPLEPDAGDHESREMVAFKLTLADPAHLVPLVLRSAQVIGGYAPDQQSPEPISVFDGDGITLGSVWPGAKIRVVMPNWYTGAAQRPIGTGGPGTHATPVPAGSPVVSDTRLPPTCQVHVYILDTVPAYSPAPTASQDPVAIGLEIKPIEDVQSQFWQHPFVRELRAPLGLVESGKYFAHYQHELLSISYVKSLLTAQDLVAEHLPNFDLSDSLVDHGPFIAGLIRQQAPFAHLHLIQVLNDRGVGTVETILLGLAEAVRQHRRHSGSIGIVNCSFTFADVSGWKSGADGSLAGIKEDLDPELLDALQKTNFGEALNGFFHALLPTGPGGTIRIRYLVPFTPAGAGPSETKFVPRLTLRPEDDQIQFLADDFIVVGASGNESTLASIQPTRNPARLNMVVGVGALGSNVSTRASYSNYADDPLRLGLNIKGAQVSIFTQAISQAVPGSRTGFGEWAGTSFSAAAISALLAKYCADCYVPKLALETVKGLDIVSYTDPQP